MKTVFGLDIGTRSIVGTVGYKKGDDFVVIAQRVCEHDTRAMLDGQIHDIEKVAFSIKKVKEELETAIGEPLKDVCIAAAGRVLRTVTIHIDLDFDYAKEVTKEDIYALKSRGIEKAYEAFTEQEKSDLQFYCVGSSVVHYYMNHYQISNPEEHKASSIGADLIATFLPDDVIDGLYKAVGLAGLEVASLTLEPIAAIQIAIPENFRMLNLGLVDVGAGTSDICITEDGAITAYGMIPMAGDSLTEVIAKHCLVDFTAAEHIKREISEQETVSYQDIIGLPQTITREKVLEITREQVDRLTEAAAGKILELNGDKPVSAVFVVGGGGKIPGYTESLAEKLNIPRERVALRGQEVMGHIVFQEQTTGDSTLVTPLGICLNYFEQSNNFIFVTFNGERIKLYDNDKLAVVDAALQADFSNEQLFPRRGAECKFKVNKKSRSVKGQLGEAATIHVNGKDANIYTQIHENDVIVVKPSTAGANGKITISELPEFRDILSVQVEENRVKVPKFAKVNGAMQSGYYEIQNGDSIEVLDYCTLGQLLEITELTIPVDKDIYVNHKKAERDTKIYENYLITFETPSADTVSENVENAATTDHRTGSGSGDLSGNAPGEGRQLQVIINKTPVTMKGKAEYVFVDAFDYIEFDLHNPQGKSVVTNLNGRAAEYMEILHDFDVLEIYWRNE